jgi:hypothetical protein
MAHERTVDPTSMFLPAQLCRRARISLALYAGHRAAYMYACNKADDAGSRVEVDVGKGGSEVGDPDA